jgi:eukaryotic-like serine/threonine-protein kinase
MDSVERRASGAPGEAPVVPLVDVGARIGAGGFAVVWEGRRGGHEVAIKVAHAGGTLAEQRFLREAAALARIGPPWVPALFEHGMLVDGRPYLVMERLAGQTLAELMAGLRVPPPLAMVEDLADAVLGSLAAVHAAGLVHRDLKPANVFIRQDGSAAVMDFGLTLLPEAGDLTRSGVAMGTTLYLAPEQLRGERDLDARTDLYAFGALLYEMVSLRPPFIGDPASIERGHLLLRPIRPRLLCPLPAALEALILDCLAKEPARRPADVAAVRARLAEACTEPVAALEVEPRAAAADGPEPLVLVWIDTNGSSAAVAAAVEGRGGWLARQRGSHYLAAFAGLSADDPLRAAHAAARQIAADEGGRAAIHVAPVTVAARPGRPPRLTGEAIERPESWLPAGDWTGVRLDPELAGRITDGDGALFGRDEIAAAVEASAARTIAERTPAICTLLAERGLGKTRLLDEAAVRFRRLAPGAQVLRVSCSGPAGGDLDAALGGSRELDVVSSAGEKLRELAARGPVALLVDDGHRADGALLDALEYAASGGSDITLWIALAALPSFAELRPRWGMRAERHDAIDLPPLDAAAASRLAAHLLLPVEYPPAQTLAQLAEWTGGVPLYLTEAVRALKRAGLVRRRANAEGSDLATELIDALPASPVVEWLGVRALGELPAAVAACARLAALLGPELGRTELEEVQDIAERAGDLAAAIDPGVGLAELERAGLLRRDGARYRFRSQLLREAVYQRMTDDERARLHRHALTRWRGQPGALAQVARHAAACGETAEAADAFLAVAEAARAEHRLVDADLYYTRALALIAAGDDERRLRALAGRGRARYRIDRIAQSLEDLAAARALAAARGDRALEADLLLEEATALDWTEAIDTSNQQVEAARALIDESADPRLAVRLRVALGRSRWRAGRAGEARDILVEAGPVAAAVGDDDSRHIALLLLAPIWVSEGRTAEAEAALDEVLDRCARTGDHLHTQAAYLNRSFLALARGSIDAAFADLRRLIAIAREVGHPLNERKASFNLAELVFWSGDDEESLALARRALLLEERFVGRVVPRTPILIARILAARGQVDQARRELARLRASAAPGDWSDGDRLLARAVDLQGEAGDWDGLLDEARARLQPEELLEVLYWASRAEPARRPALHREAEPLLAMWPLLRARFDQCTQG